MTAQERFADVVEALLDLPDVTPPSETGREFGSNALKVKGKIFAMLVRGNLVVKLPAARVATLIASGEGRPFDAGKGKPMREWLSVDLASSADWLDMAQEALSFVSAKR